MSKDYYFYCGPAQLTTDYCSWGGPGDHLTLLCILSLRAETKTNRPKLAMITLDRSMFCKPFCLVSLWDWCLAGLDKKVATTSMPEPLPKQLTA